MTNKYQHICDEMLAAKISYTLDQMDEGSSSFALEATLAELLAEKRRRSGG